MGMVFIMMFGIKTTALNKVAIKLRIVILQNTLDCILQKQEFFQTRKVKDIPIKYIKGDIRMTLDYQEDFEFFKNVIEGVLQNH